MAPEDIVNMPHAEDDVTYPSHESIDTAPTKFPGLTSTQATESKLRAPQKSVRLTDFRVPREVLILSWAHLLRCYTGEHEPVFLVDEKVVRVDLSISKVDQTGSLGTHLYSKGATRICFRHEVGRSEAM